MSHGLGWLRASGYLSGDRVKGQFLRDWTDELVDCRVGCALELLVQSLESGVGVVRRDGLGLRRLLGPRTRWRAEASSCLVARPISLGVEMKGRAGTLAML